MVGLYVAEKMFARLSTSPVRRTTFLLCYIKAMAAKRLGLHIGSRGRLLLLWVQHRSRSTSVYALSRSRCAVVSVTPTPLRYLHSTWGRASGTSCYTSAYDQTWIPECSRGTLASNPDVSTTATDIESLRIEATTTAAGDGRARNTQGPCARSIAH